MDGFTYQQIKDLQQLVAPPKDDSDTDSDDENLRQRLSRQKIGPGSIGKTKETSRKKEDHHDEQPESSRGSEILDAAGDSDIWPSVEVSAIAAPVAEDPRPAPRYEMKFRQAVGTEDIFLGMNMKTPGTASCEWISLRAWLTGESREKVELSVESDHVDLRSPKYRLQLPTPFPVDPNGSSAKWHSDSDCLEITLKLTRELDDVNF